MCFVVRYGEEVEKYLDVYLKTPGLLKEDVAKALLARGNARKLSGERLLAKAQQGYFASVMLHSAKQRQDFQAVLQLDPLNRQESVTCKEVSSTYQSQSYSRSPRL
jgi:hypothetical protein